MSEALIRGFIASGICAPEDVVASVRSTARWQAMESIGVQPVGDALRGGAAEVAARSDTILLGVSLLPHNFTPDSKAAAMPISIKQASNALSAPAQHGHACCPPCCHEARPACESSCIDPQLL